MRWLVLAIARLPSWIHLLLGNAIANLAWFFRIRRRVVLENLRLAFPEKTEAERRGIARQSYRHFGEMIAGFLRVPGLTKTDVDKLFLFDGWEKIDAALAEGKGAIVCSGHLGHFELFAAGTAVRGYEVSVVTRRLGRARANELWRAIRHESGMEELVVQKGQTLKAAMRGLRENRLLAYVIDQNQSRRRAIFPTFFGVPAATSPTPAIMAIRTGAPILFAVTVPLEDGRHQITVEGPYPVPDLPERDAAILSLMQQLNDRLEHWVRRFPERWYWLHRRWKTRP